MIEYYNTYAYWNQLKRNSPKVINPGARYSKVFYFLADEYHIACGKIMPYLPLLVLFLPPVIFIS